MVILLQPQQYQPRAPYSNSIYKNHDSSDKIELTPSCRNLKEICFSLNDFCFAEIHKVQNKIDIIIYSVK